MLSIDIVSNNPEYYFNSHVQSDSRLVWHIGGVSHFCLGGHLPVDHELWFFFFTHLYTIFSTFSIIYSLYMKSSFPKRYKSILIVFMKMTFFYLDPYILLIFNLSCQNGLLAQSEHVKNNDCPTPPGPQHHTERVSNSGFRRGRRVL